LHSLYELHPVFEFYLTAYFGFILAPRFLSEFLLYRIPKYQDKSRENVCDLLDKITNEIEVKISKYDELDDDEKKYFEIHITGFTELKEEIITLKKSAVDKKIDALRNELADGVNSSYEKVFPFSAIYSFLILLLNGCGWFTTHQEIFIKSLSYFNLFVFVFMIILLIRGNFFNIIKKWVDKYKWISKVKKSEFSNWHSFYIMVTFFIASFLLLPFFDVNGIISLPDSLAEMFLIFGCVLVGIFPLVLYGIVLGTSSKKCYQSLFKEKIKEIESKKDSIIGDFRTVYNAQLEKRMI
jgi:hypothetical protein